jgi:redox-sensitive bicupin YhaK (pirin superfamily)
VSPADKRSPNVQRSISDIFRGVAASDGAGVRMTRVIASPMLDHFDPFLLLDEFRSDDPNDYIAGFPDHPHRGFETVTYMLAGAMEHGDNKGNTGLLGPGSVQWMTAGRGIVHSEMPMQEDGLMWGFQLWVNLPAAKKMTEPRYQDIPAADVPTVQLGDGVSVNLIAGTIDGVEGPVSGVDTEPFFLDVSLAAGTAVTLDTPATHNAFVYVFGGEVSVDERALGKKEIGLLTRGDSVALAAGNEAARCLLVGGRPLEEPVARYGPFVMNTEQELRQAFVDFQSGRF